MTNPIHITAETIIADAKPLRPMRGIQAFLALLIEKDRSYREARKLARLDAGHLRDMGLPGNPASSDFYRAGGTGPAGAALGPLTGW